MPNAKKKFPPRGEKQQYAREALQSLGLDTDYAAAARWVRDRYGAVLTDSTFYHNRKQVRQEQAAQAPAAVETSAHPAEARPDGPTPREGVAELVTKARELIERLGKDEAKRLIDAL